MANDYEPPGDLPDNVREACERIVENDDPMRPMAEILLEMHGYEP